MKHLGLARLSRFDKCFPRVNTRVAGLHGSQNSNDHRTDKQNDGLDCLRHHDRLETANDGVDRCDHRDYNNRRHHIDTKESFEHLRTGVQADTNMDQHCGHDSHHRHDRTCIRMVTSLKVFRQRGNPRLKIEGSKNQRQTDQRKGCHPFKITDE